MDALAHASEASIERYQRLEVPEATARPRSTSPPLSPGCCSPPTPGWRSSDPGFFLAWRRKGDIRGAFSLATVASWNWVGQSGAL